MHIRPFCIATYTKISSAKWTTIICRPFWVTLTFISTSGFCVQTSHYICKSKVKYTIKFKMCKGVNVYFIIVQIIHPLLHFVSFMNTLFQYIVWCLLVPSCLLDVYLVILLSQLWFVHVFSALYVSFIFLIFGTLFDTWRWSNSELNSKTWNGSQLYWYIFSWFILWISF